MTTIHRAVFFSAIEKYASQILAIGTIAVMSRILSPAEVGLYLVANTVFLLADNLRAFGVGVYIVQAPELRRASLRSAFTIALILSLVIGGALNLTAEPISAFYGEPELARLLSIATLAFLWLPFASPTIALLQRELAFRDLAILNLGGSFVTAATTICLGLAGAGAASYVWGYVAGSATIAGLAILARPDFGLFRPSLAEARRILAFGTVSSTVTVINMAYDLLPRLAFGKILGFDAVGIYSRAVTICQLPDRAIGSALQPVVLPAMSAHVRAGGDLKAAYLRGHALMSAVQWPLLALLALLADPVVRILLGSQWSEAAPLVRLVALASMALAPAFMTFPVLVASGRIRDTLLSSLVAVPPALLIAIGAAQFGLTAAAASQLVIAPLQMVVALAFVRRAIGLTGAELAAASRRSLLLTVAAIVAPAAVVLHSPDGLVLGPLETLLCLIGAAAGWIAALGLFDHPLRAELIAMAGYYRTRRRVGQGQSAAAAPTPLSGIQRMLKLFGRTRRST